MERIKNDDKSLLPLALAKTFVKIILIWLKISTIWAKAQEILYILSIRQLKLTAMKTNIIGNESQN